ncbi:NAD dependent epimerase/dehydratase [Coprinopsis sp. MPI-PUGE-AT-0042]|nr:NAD dependent epimerase/dehydratase [Coprinopsis sp. MPI-PUGE-AT-0042]
MDLDLKDVHVLVTGASGGIGLAIVQTYLEQGAKITAHYNTNKTTLEPLEAQHPTQLKALPADLSKEPDVQSLLAKSQETFGAVQILVVNHAIYNNVPTPLADMGLDQWKRTMDANLTSSFLVTREYLRALRSASGEEKERSAVVLIGSTAGKYGEAGHADYAASKSALYGAESNREIWTIAMMYGLTMSLKNEIVKIAPRGRVNTVAPGWVKTPLAEESLKDPKIIYSALATYGPLPLSPPSLPNVLTITQTRMPLRKVATPEDVASQVVILSSGKVSGHITGQVLMIEGGMEGDDFPWIDDLVSHAKRLKSSGVDDMLFGLP